MRISDWSSDVCSSDLQVGAHRVERAGFGIDRHLPCGKRARNPVLEPLDTLHAFVGAAVDWRHFGHGLPIALAISGIPCRLRLGGVEIDLAFGAAFARVDPPQPAGKALTFKE